MPDYMNTETEPRKIPNDSMPMLASGKIVIRQTCPDSSKNQIALYFLGVHVWQKMRLLWDRITYFKSGAILLTINFQIKVQSGISQGIDLQWFDYLSDCLEFNQIFYVKYFFLKTYEL